MRPRLRSVAYALFVTGPCEETPQRAYLFGQLAERVEGTQALRWAHWPAALVLPCGKEDEFAGLKLAERALADQRQLLRHLSRVFVQHSGESTASPSRRLWRQRGWRWLHRNVLGRVTHSEALAALVADFAGCSAERKQGWVGTKTGLAR